MRKVYRSILALVLSLVMVLGMIAISAAMQPEFYDVWVGGIQVSSANADDVLGDGTVCYDAARKTLTLKNANIKCGVESLRTIYADGDLSINLIGANSVLNVDASDGLDAIYVYGDLEINAASPDASLTVISSFGCGIGAEAVTINGGKVHASSNDIQLHTDPGSSCEIPVGEGISAVTTVTITGGEVTAEGNNGGICATGGIIVTGGTTKATGGVVGIASAGDVIISDSEVTVSGGENGLYTDTAIIIDNSTVKAYGETLHGIVAPSISISDATVETEGYLTGIFAFDDNCSVVISNSTVTAKASDVEGTAIDAIFGTLTIEDNAKVIAGCREGLCADKINILKNSTVEIDAAQNAIYFCDELNFGNNWYKWSIDGGKSFKDSSEMPLKVEEASETRTLLIEPNGKYPTISKPTNIHGVPSFGSAEQPLESPKTFDGGIALPISMAILAATGGAWLAKKKD